MFIISILLRQSPQVFLLHYDQIKDADAVVKRYSDGRVTLFAAEDDYGSKAVIETIEITGLILTEIDREMAAQEVVKWAEINRDIKLQKKVQESPGARILQPQGVRT